MKKTELIVALDVSTLSQAIDIVERLRGVVKYFKVGAQLFVAAGPAAIDAVRQRGGEVFLDLKFHDIPHTVANAVAEASRLGVFMMTVHASGGSAMLEAAQRAALKTSGDLKQTRPLIVGVTVLTSQEGQHVFQDVLRLAQRARDVGVDGVVASGEECAALRKKMGDSFVIVVPGIRPAGADIGDQKRVVTPPIAKAAGADFIVVGRPIVEAQDPRQAAEGIINSLS